MTKGRLDSPIPLQPQINFVPRGILAKRVHSHVPAHSGSYLSRRPVIPSSYTYHICHPPAVALKNTDNATRLHVKDAHNKVGSGNSDEVVAAVQFHKRDWRLDADCAAQAAFGKVPDLERLVARGRESNRVERVYSQRSHNVAVRRRCQRGQGRTGWREIGDLSMRKEN